MGVSLVIGAQRLLLKELVFASARSMDEETQKESYVEMSFEPLMPLHSYKNGTLQPQLQYCFV